MNEFLDVYTWVHIVCQGSKSGFTVGLIKFVSHPFYPIIWAGFEQEQCLEKFTNSWPSSSNLHSNELFFPLFHFLHWDGQKWISKNITNSWLSASNLLNVFALLSQKYSKHTKKNVLTIGQNNYGNKIPFLTSAKLSLV